MSGKRKKVRRKSGWLTGIVLVSIGLIAGFQGFEIARNEATSSGSTLTLQDLSYRDNAVARRVSSLDELVTATLEQNAEKNDRRGLADLIKEAQETPVQTNVAPYNDFPVVNRALKGDREFINRPAVTARNTASSVPVSAQPVVEKSSKLHAGQQAVIEAAPSMPDPVAHRSAVARAARPVSTALFADGADVALFAADIPLPAQLSLNKGSRQFLSAVNSSPMSPRTFGSGKAFGGLAEREFQKRERRCMTTALYFEARSEPEAGQIAVGQVVMNRVKSPDYPDTICGVVYQGSRRTTGCQFSFTCDGKVDKPNNKAQWERSKHLANQVLEGQVWLRSIGPSTHYHATYVKPIWRHKMARLKQIGRHIFYKSPNISVTHTYQRYVSGKRS